MQYNVAEGLLQLTSIVSSHGEEHTLVVHDMGDVDWDKALAAAENFDFEDSTLDRYAVTEELKRELSDTDNSSPFKTIIKDLNPLDSTTFAALLVRDVETLRMWIEEECADMA
jgi:hypothetical protein